MTAMQPPNDASRAITEERRQSRRVNGVTQSASSPGNGSRTDGTSVRPSRTTPHRDAVNQLTRLYCELGTATFDSLDGRLLSHEYHRRRAALCAEIRRLLSELGHMKGPTAR